jgi:hypothetical protein
LDTIHTLITGPLNTGNRRLPTGILLGRFERIKKPLHPGFFAGRGVFFDDPLPGGRIKLADHFLEGGLSLTCFLLLSQNRKFLGAGSYGRFNRFIPEPALFALPVTFFSRTFFLSQRIPPYLKSEGRRSSRLHFSHSATFLTLPFSKTVFILTSPPQEQKNFWVALVVREFLLA